MKIIQISDTHVGDPGELVYGHFDTNQALQDAVAAINQMEPAPDLVIHTGDITAHGTKQRYETFRDLIAPLAMPILLLPGNHDDRDALRAVFGATPALPALDAEFLHYCCDDLPVRIICCDSVIAGETPGEMCARRLAWLADRLDEDEAKPTIVALHHPPFYSGMTGTSAKGLLHGGDELAALLAKHPQVIRVLAGHVHRPMTASFGGTIAFAGPTTCYPFGLDTGEERVLSITHEPPAVAVHLWLDDASPNGAGLITHVQPIGQWAAPIELLRDGKRVLPAVSPQ